MEDEADRQSPDQLDDLEIAGVHVAILAGRPLTERNLTRATTFQLAYAPTTRRAGILLGSGLLSYVYVGDGGR